MSFYGKHSVQHNIYQELLTFRSRYDQNVKVSESDSNVTQDKMFWVKTLKDYPYVEISHGKPKMDWAAGVTASASTAVHEGSNTALVTTITTTTAIPSITRGLKWADGVLIPEPQVSDTGHIIGAESTQLNLPDVRTKNNDKINMTKAVNAKQAIYTFEHKPVGSSGSTQTYANSPIASGNISNKLHFNKSYNFSHDRFDQWGHYLSQSTQTIQMPNVTASSPLSATINGNGDAVIAHKVGTAVIPSLKDYNFIDPINERSKGLCLEDLYLLQAPQTDAYGHSSKTATLPFTLLHHEPLEEKVSVFSYLTDFNGDKTQPTKDKVIQNPAKETSGIKTKASVYAKYEDEDKYLKLTVNVPKTVEIALKNFSIPENMSSREAFITIEPPSAGIIIAEQSFNTEFLIKDTFSGKGLRYRIIKFPTIGTETTVLNLKVTASSMFEKSSITLKAQPSSIAAYNIICTTQSELSPNDPETDKVLIWDENKILQLPVLNFNEQGHITSISRNGFMLPNYKTMSGKTLSSYAALNYLDKYLSSNLYSKSILDQYANGESPTLYQLLQEYGNYPDQPIEYSYLEASFKAKITASVKPQGLVFNVYELVDNQLKDYYFSKEINTIEIGNNNDTSTNYRFIVKDYTQQIYLELQEKDYLDGKRFILDGSDSHVITWNNKLYYAFTIPSLNDFAQTPNSVQYTIPIVQDGTLNYTKLKFKLAARLTQGNDTPIGSIFDIQEDGKVKLAELTISNNNGKYNGETYYYSNVATLSLHQSNSEQRIYIKLKQSDTVDLSQTITCYLNSSGLIFNDGITKLVYDSATKVYTLYMNLKAKPIGGNNKPYNSNDKTNTDVPDDTVVNLENRMSAIENKAINLTNDIEDKVTYKNTSDQLVNVDEALTVLLNCYSNLVKNTAQALYSSSEDKVNSFVKENELPMTKSGSSYLPATGGKG